MVLALDPSFTAFGWAVVSNIKIVKYGVIKTSAAQTDTERVTYILDCLSEVMNDHPQVCRVVSEEPVGSKSARAAKALSMCKALVVSFSFFTGLPVKFVHARDVKKAITGNSSAEKEELVRFVENKYNVTFKADTKLLREAVCDAVATLEIT